MTRESHSHHGEGFDAAAGRLMLRYLLHDLRQYLDWQMVGGATWAAWQLKHVLEQAQNMDVAITGAYQAGDITADQADHNYAFALNKVLDAVERADYARYADILHRMDDGSFNADMRRWMDQDRGDFK